MRILLLGAGGFVGRTVRHAAAADPGLVLICHARRLGEPGWSALDIVTASDDDVRALIVRSEPDVIVNATGATAGDPSVLAAVNVRLVARILTALAEVAPRVRFVQIGSAAEYGQGALGTAIDEGTRPRPVSVYGETKLAGSRLVTQAIESGLDAVVLRVFNPVGAGLPSSTLPGNAAHQMRFALATGANTIHLGPLGDVRDFVDAQDVADAVLAATSRSNPYRGLINVGSGTACEVRRLVRDLAHVAGFRGEVVEAQRPSNRPGFVRWQQADIRLARTVLGWEPRRSLRESLVALWEDVSLTGDA